MSSAVLNPGAPILVTGGNGTLGRRVVARLRAAGHPVRVLGRHPQPASAGVEQLAGDLETGEGVDLAVQGVDVIIHCAGQQKGDGGRARTLIDAAKRGGRSPHIVFISVVGADRVPVLSAVDRAQFGYFASKRDAELVIERAGLPYSTLRATQFHDLVLTAVEAVAKPPVALAFAGIAFQPVDADAVAERLVEIALGDPAGLVAEMGGPRAYPMSDLVRSYLAAVGKRKPVVQLRSPGKAAAAHRDGANLALDHPAGGRTWEQFLAERVA